MTSTPLSTTVDPRRAERPQARALEGRHVILSPLLPERDAQPLFAATCGPDQHQLWAYMSNGPFADLTAMRGFLETAAASTDPLFLAIRGKAGAALLGYASFMRIEPGHRVIEIGNIMFTPALQRTAAATEAVYLMARHAFDDLGYRRLEWKCNALNAPSRRAAERLGFLFEGVFRNHMIVKGRNRDTAWFAMTDDEWPVRKAAFAAWLAAENFAADGRERRKLAALRGDTGAPAGG